MTGGKRDRITTTTQVFWLTKNISVFKRKKQTIEFSVIPKNIHVKVKKKKNNGRGGGDTIKSENHDHSLSSLRFVCLFSLPLLEYI